MKNIRLLILAAALPLGACSYGRQFSNQAALDAYLAHLGLASVPMGEASLKLVQDGFNCGPSKDGQESVCERVAASGTCRQGVSVNVRFGPDEKSSTVTSRLWWTCL